MSHKQLANTSLNMRIPWKARIQMVGVISISMVFKVSVVSKTPPWKISNI